MAKSVEIKRDKDNFIVIDGEEYYIERTKFKKIDGVEHEDKILFKKFKQKEYKEYIDTITKEISKQVTKEELLKELVGGMEMYALRKMAKRIKDKKPIKKQSGCLGFKIGDTYMQLIH